MGRYDPQNNLMCAGRTINLVWALAFLSGLLGYWEPSSGAVVLSLIFGFTIGVMWLGSEVSEIFRSGR